MLEKIGKRALRVPGSIRGVLLVLSAALATYWIVADRGVYFLVSEYQATKFMDGEYSPWLSGMMAVVASLIPSVCVIQILTYFYPKTQEEINDEANGL